MKKINNTVIGTILSLVLSVNAFAMPWSEVNTPAGKVFAGEKSLSLYTFQKDGNNQSNCYDECATAWPPFIAKNGAKATGAWTLVKRKDGNMQWSLKGAPLYYWIGDTKAGDTTGDGVGGVWDLARP